MAGTIIKIALAALFMIPLVALIPGCGPECIDKYDCASRGKAGENYTCVDSKCVLGSPFPLPDAGSGGGGGMGGGTGGGMGGGTGGGTGGGSGSDAGMEDAGVEDAGVEDAGVEDAGVEDAGVEDAGVEDAGNSDAGDGG
jgi:hypothetical protein